MTVLLASVTGPEEAEAAIAGGADLIDLKDPAAGPLGRLPDPAARAVLARVGGRRAVSATAGEEPLAGLAALGVGLVKVEAARAPDPRSWPGLRLVAVLLADRAPDLGAVPGLAAAGFAGVMLDTAGKEGGGLRAHVGDAALVEFVAAAREAGLLVGLAGSLTIDDVPPLMNVRPDLLGFRGALCAGGRLGPVQAERVSAIRSAMAAAGAQRAPHSVAAGSPPRSVARST